MEGGISDSHVMGGSAIFLAGVAIICHMTILTIHVVLEHQDIYARTIHGTHENVLL
jgi:hypothetical protein